MSIQQTVRMYITAFQHWLCSSPSRLEVWDVTHTFHGSLDRGKRWESERKKAEVAAVLTGVVLTDVRFGGCGGADPAEHWQSGLWVLRPQHWPHPHPATSARAACAGSPHCEFCVSCLLSLPSCFLSVSCLLFPVLFPVSCFLSPVSCLLFPASCFLPPVSCLLFPLSCFLFPVLSHLSHRERDEIGCKANELCIIVLLLVLNLLCFITFYFI